MKLTHCLDFALLGPALAMALSTCGGQLAAPPTGPHRAGAHNPAIIVAFPPPPAKVECIPEQPREQCVWLDGSWRWTPRRWQWLEGAWLVPPANCYYAAAYSQWLRSGPISGGKQRDQLYYFRGAWYPERAGATCSAPTICRKATPTDEC
jgi:hypothetical protein